ncbi:MAG: co-chaperone GroES [Rickettsiaceae bacterium]
MDFKPLHDKVLIEPIEETQTSGGIIIPDNAKEKPLRGKVVAVGTGSKTSDGKTIPLDVKVGFTVLFAQWSGNEVKLDDKKFIVLKESDIIGIIQ